MTGMDGGIQGDVQIRDGDGALGAEWYECNSHIVGRVEVNGGSFLQRNLHDILFDGVGNDT
jgi:hypothetical protein